MSYKAGDRFQERAPKLAEGEAPPALRQIELLNRVDPYGKDAPPVWEVRNTASGHVSTMRESNLAERFVPISAAE